MNWIKLESGCLVNLDHIITVGTYYGEDNYLETILGSRMGITKQDYKNICEKLNIKE